MNYLDFKEYIISGVQDNWERDKFIVPVLFLLIRDDLDHKVAVIPVNSFMETLQHKDFLSEILHNICSEMDVVSYCLVSESWAAKVDKKDCDPDYMIPPSEHPDRQEVIMLFFETKYNSETLYYDIIRDDEDAIISDLKELESTGVGRFSNLLKDSSIMN